MTIKLPSCAQEFILTRYPPCLRETGVRHDELSVGNAARCTSADGNPKLQQTNEKKRAIGSLDFEAKAIESLDSAHSLGDDTTFIALLKACTKQKDLCKGSILHAHALKKGCLTKDSFVGNCLLHMYARCGSLAKAQQVFDELSVHDVASWTSLLAGYADTGHGKEALHCFEQMQHEGLAPDGIAFACVLKACGALRASEKTKEIHLQIAANGFLCENLILGSALIDTYAKLGELSKAKQVLDELPVRNVVTWNALITGYCQLGHGEEALDCFDRMKREGISPSTVTFASILKACGSIRAAEKGEEIHGEIITKGLLGKNIVLGSALMDMYAKCGALAKAHQVFNELPMRDVVSWTSLITGYCQHGLGEEALSCLDQMKHHGLSPNAMTFSCILKVCGVIGAAEKGEEVHAEVARKWSLHDDIVLGNALVYMYAKCGLLSKAQEVFDELLGRSVVSWSALIAGYSEEGYGEEALSCFESMKHDGLSPDAAIFSCILKACGTIGAAEEGQMYFETMSVGHGIIPSFEHHTSMVDLFCRTGNFDKAMTILEKIPSLDYLPAWFTLLGACRKWGDVKLGRLAFDHAVQLNDKFNMTYVGVDKVAITTSEFDIAFH